MKKMLLKYIVFMSNKMKICYKHYGNKIIIIDSTYKKNRYDFPLVNICGTDDDGKNVLYAHAIICNETQETYDWVLSNFLELHNKVHPKVIVSDQDPALIQSIKNIFPNGVHLWCQWHLIQNLKKKFYLLEIKKSK